MAAGLLLPRNMVHFRPIIWSMPTRLASRPWPRLEPSLCCCREHSMPCRKRSVPPIDLLRRHGVPMAIGTDCNPGTSPVLSAPLMLQMACTLFRLTPEEALAGMTREGARALGLLNEIGTVTHGQGRGPVHLAGEPSQ
jgi:hypothetical protein